MKHDKKSVKSGLFRQVSARCPPWRKRRPNSPRRPWLVSLVISSARLNSPVTTVVFADQLAQLTPTSRQAQRAAIAQALGLDVPAPVRAGEDQEPLRDSASRVRTVLCVRSVPYVFVYLSSTGIKKTSRLEWHVHPPYIPIRHRRASSCAPIDRLHSAYGSWVFVSTSLVQELIWPCNDYDIVGRCEPA